jgi:hypothetical protein
MNSALALDAVPRRMQELGFTRHRVETRSLLVEPAAQTVVEAWNAWLWFPADLQPKGVRITVESGSGLLDLEGGRHREQQYEHTGRVTLRNLGKTPAYATFIQATPL